MARRALATSVIGPQRQFIGDLRGMELDVTVIGGNGRVIPVLHSIDNGSGDAILRTQYRFAEESGLSRNFSSLR